MIKHIYVDMDGVLADFFKRFEELFKAEPEIDYPSNTQKKKAYQKRWLDFIEGKQFETLDPMPDLEMGLRGLRILQKAVPVEILGSTAKPEFIDELGRQKKIWLDKQGIDFKPIFVPGKHLKRQYAGPGKVLIDDTASNIEQWEEDGGIGILHKDWTNTLIKLGNVG